MKILKLIKVIKKANKFYKKNVNKKDFEEIKNSKTVKKFAKKVLKVL